MTPSNALLWVKGSGNSWCKLFDLNLGLLHTTGVFVIWHGGYPSRVVRVGHGDVAMELQACCGDPRVLSYLKYGALFVTWATVDASDGAGVARHLADTLHPLIEDSAGARTFPIAVNAPFVGPLSHRE